MQCRCPACQAEFSYEGEAPRFCSRCGTSLSTVIAGQLEATGAYTPQDNTVTPHGSDGQPQATPDQVGGYRLLKKLGAGGMGAVYEAEDMASGQRVALKLIKRGSDISDSSAQRFRQEGRLASSIAHPRCVFVITADEDRGQPYIVMELMPGQTLIDLVRKAGPLPASQAVSLIHDIIEGLQEAHRLGLVHRDVKPANCFLDEEGRAKIGDFGLAKVLDQHQAGDAPTAVDLTGTGTFVGTPLYAAPEQIKGQQIDQQVDVYAVGATLYFLLTGKAPFEDQQSVTAVLARIVSEDPDPITETRHDLPTGLESLVFKALERDRSKRFRDLESLRQALLPFLPGRTRIVRFGLRIAAFLIDMVFSFISLGFLSFIIAQLFLFADKNFQDSMDFLFTDSLVSVLVFAVLGQLFFLVPEMLWGTTLGKWSCRLRLTDPVKGGKPSKRQVLVRNAVFLLAGLVPEVTLTLMGISLQNKPVIQINSTDETGENEPWHKEAGDSIFHLLIAILIVSVTMRRSNGYRGLHEILSDTATIWLPAPPPRTALDMAKLVQAMPVGAQLLSEPIILGGFTLTHALWQTADQAVLLGKDERLARLVWVWQRPASLFTFTASRRKASRPTRWRWLATGTRDNVVWDAFLATPGVTLQSLVDQRLTLDWTGTYHLLREMTDELLASNQEGSLPPFFAPRQLWLQQRSNMQWLDVPLQPQEITPSPSEQQQLGFLGTMAKLALEGADASSSSTLHRPIPVSSFTLVEQLLSQPPRLGNLNELSDKLHYLGDGPYRVSRWARFRAIALQGIWFLVLLFQSFATMAMVAWGIQIMTGQWNDWPSVGMLVNRLQRVLLPVFCVFYSVLWAFWWRGRWSFGIAGLAMRRYDGQPVERWRCAFRTLLILGPLMLANWLSQAVALTTRWQGMAIYWNQAPMIILLVVTLVWLFARPQQVWYDRLAGTVVVPD
jgi:serine/threonine protein kinase